VNYCLLTVIGKEEIMYRLPCRSHRKHRDRRIVERPHRVPVLLKERLPIIVLIIPPMPRIDAPLVIHRHGLEPELGNDDPDDNSGKVADEDDPVPCHKPNPPPPITATPNPAIAVAFVMSNETNGQCVRYTRT